MLIIGLALVIWGTLLPWVCYYGLAYFCISGLALDITVLQSIGGVQIVFIALTIATLYYLFYIDQTFKKSGQAVGIAIVGGVLLFLTLGTPFVLNGGGVKFVLGAVVVFWIILRAK